MASDEKKNNGCCIVSLCFGIASLIFVPAGLPPMIAIIFGIIGIIDFDESKQKNKSFGVVGLVMGILFFAIYLNEIYW